MSRHVAMTLTLLAKKLASDKCRPCCDRIHSLVMCHWLHHFDIMADMDTPPPPQPLPLLLLLLLLLPLVGDIGIMLCWLTPQMICHCWHANILGKYWEFWPNMLSNSVIRAMPDNMTCHGQPRCCCFCWTEKNSKVLQKIVFSARKWQQQYKMWWYMLKYHFELKNDH